MAIFFNHPSKFPPSTSISFAGTENKDDEIAAQSLSEMGFTIEQARKALSECNGSVERAVEWLFSHRCDVNCDVSMDDGKKMGVSESSGEFPFL